ncbi:alpha/beta hydrolase [Actinopolymorpha sp. B11F2]|uniref:alpha/beta hydrolase n=1 Tax=Actinopolymorpha sp. B11F2 TaxID=3160862 RepID=UPI0032E4F711
MARTRRIVMAALATVVLASGAGPSAQPTISGDVLTSFPGAAAWRAARQAGLPMPAAVSASPAAVADFFDSLPLTEGGALARRFPAIVGNLDGAPPGLRYAANQKEAASHGVDHRIDLRGRQFLALDPRDRGLAVEVVGDLRTADRVAVIVPGAGADLDHLDTRGGVAASARALLAEAERQEPGTNLAVVAWAGYPTPNEPDPSAMQGDLARDGARRLHRFLAGLAAYTPAQIGLFCHSYGSVVCGMTPLPKQVSDIVVYGSPGVRHATATGLSRTARVWAALADSDPIRWLPAMRFGDYGHGPNPVDPAFGARVMATSGAQGHSGYFDIGSESLRNFARIALDRTTEVSLTAPNR